MITGQVRIGREAIIPVTVRGAGDRVEAVNAVLDTGFDQFS